MVGTSVAADLNNRWRSTIAFKLEANRELGEGSIDLFDSPLVNNFLIEIRLRYRVSNVHFSLRNILLPIEPPAIDVYITVCFDCNK